MSLNAQRKAERHLNAFLPCCKAVGTLTMLPDGKPDRSRKKNGENKMYKREFGKNTKGEAATLYSLTNQNGMELLVSDFGATVQALLVPDRDGVKRDVVLGYDDPIGYEGPSGTFFGATVGRNANRIGNAVFTLNGKTYQLDQNNGTNNLHSGWDFWSFRIWKVTEAKENQIIFALDSADGDQGYPGAVSVTVTYTLTEDNAVVIRYQAEPEEDTPLNLTNHSYFNLNGHDSGSIREQILWLDADAFTPTDSGLIPTGEIRSVEGTPMDFRTPKAVGQDMDTEYEPLQLGKGYDHNWVLNNHGTYAKVAELFSEESGIQMEVFTDRSGIQIYTGNYLDQEAGKHGAVYGQNQGICFETQCFPDAVNQPAFPSSVCKKGEHYQTQTMYRFSVRK